MPGDANLDGRVDALDLNIIGLNWRAQVESWREGDFNADGRVDANDLNALAINWRKDIFGETALVERAPRAALALGAVLPDQDSVGRLAKTGAQLRALSAEKQALVAKNDVESDTTLSRRYSERRHTLFFRPTNLSPQAQKPEFDEEVIDLVFAIHDLLTWR